MSVKLLNITNNYLKVREFALSLSYCETLETVTYFLDGEIDTIQMILETSYKRARFDLIDFHFINENFTSKENINTLYDLIYENIQDIEYKREAQIIRKNNKQSIGRRLYPLVQKLEPDRPAKITGILLDMDSAALLHLLDRPEELEETIKQVAAAIYENQNE